MGHRSKAVVVAGLLATSALAAPAWSQSNSPTFRKLDANGVDLVQGDFITSFVEGSIGSGDAALILRRMIGAIGQAGTQGTSSWDRIWFTVTSVDKVVEFGTRMDRFPGAEARGSTLTGSGGAWQYFAPDGTVYRDLSRGVSREDLEAHNGRQGTLSVDGETMTVTWSDGKTTTSTIERDGETFTWDMGIFSPVKPFEDESDLAGRWEGGESLSGGLGRAMMSKTLELRGDGTFTWHSVSFLSSDGVRTSVSAGAQGGTSGKWELEDYTLTLTSADGKTYSGVAFPYHDGANPRVFFNGILYKREGE